MATDRLAHDRLDRLVERVALLVGEVSDLQQAFAELATLIDTQPEPAPDPDGVKPGSEA